MTSSAALPESNQPGSVGKFDPRTLLLVEELDQLKSVYRRAYLSDQSRHENSAEHSWHMAMTLLILHRAFALEMDIDHAVRMALVHDIAEIGAGDIPVYSTERETIGEAEEAYLLTLAAAHDGFAHEIHALWQEFEQQETIESHWVKVVDRLLPFMLNLATDGQTWRDLNVCRADVERVNQPIARTAPQLYAWMAQELDVAISKGWLRAE